jgi:hypothetical protein
VADYRGRLVFRNAMVPDRRQVIRGVGGANRVQCGGSRRRSRNCGRVAGFLNVTTQLCLSTANADLAGAALIAADLWWYTDSWLVRYLHEMVET